MSAKWSKAEVRGRFLDFRYVPQPEVAMPVEEPSTASRAEIRRLATNNQTHKTTSNKIDNPIGCNAGMSPEIS
jgi:hypothetical protein